jgi:dipeptidyl aminopeptidase/acylaminoacyl peptidase
MLVLHGTKDDRMPLRQAGRFAETLQAKEVRVKIVVFPAAGHTIPVEAQYRATMPFLQPVLRREARQWEGGEEEEGPPCHFR